MVTDLLPKFKGLGAILSEQVDAHKHLTSSALELRDALVACDHEAIERLTLENERDASKVRQLENKRIGFLKDAGLAVDGNISFSSIEEVLAGEELTAEGIMVLDELRNTRAELAALINELDHHNQLNITLIGQALEYHQLSMQLILNAITGEPAGYTREGTSRPDERSGLFDGIA